MMCMNLQSTHYIQRTFFFWGKHIMRKRYHQQFTSDPTQMPSSPPRLYEQHILSLPL
jgi:hypothetical protein